jgi:hypothetical protein
MNFSKNGRVDCFEVPIEKNGRLLISIHVAEKEMDF